MAMKSSKAQQGALTNISFDFSGGVNYAQSPSLIADNELTKALNILYDSQSGAPKTRPGTSCVTATALPSRILKIYYYEKSALQKWLVCASGGKLYYLDSDAWVEIGSLNDSDTTPGFITYNTYLLIADGGTNLKKWDGSTLTSLSDGLSATAIAEAGARVVINSKTDPDLVTFSGIEDETMWDTADPTNPAIGIRAGFGDNMVVNGFGVFGTDLIVSKYGASAKKLYRLSMASTPSEWVLNLLSANNCAQNADTIVSAFNNVFFIDVDGFKSVKGVTEYGDLQVDAIGKKVNPVFGGAECPVMAYIPKYTALWYVLSGLVYCYHRMIKPDGSTDSVFTVLQFMHGQIMSIVQAGTVVYLAGQNGYLYKLDDLVDQDEVSPGIFENYGTVITSKRFNFFGGCILRKTSLQLTSLDFQSESSAYLRVNTAERDGSLLKTISILSAAQYLADATDDLYDADIMLADMSNSTWIENTHNRVRGTSLQWQIDSQSGRFGVETLQAEIALVTG